MNPNIKGWKFYLLSFTWGLPMVLIGLIAAFILRVFLHVKPRRLGYCLYFEYGEDWGGVSLGLTVITMKNPSDHTIKHEHGHAIQNCYLGFLFPFLVAIPSGIRYQYRSWMEYKHPDKKLKPYDAIWFEGSATELGTEFFDLYY